mmetsp:Transcript_15780/g.25698  ORF Transcript_15780/g.25698 Transcript_15780/m.25698 type:complete len:81 (+) Transcript_15780:327-569(+)
MAHYSEKQCRAKAVYWCQELHPCCVLATHDGTVRGALVSIALAATAHDSSALPTISSDVASEIGCRTKETRMSERLSMSA